MKKERAPLRPGERCTVREMGRKFKGTVHSVGNTYATVIADDDGACRPYYPNQLRHLKPKPRVEKEQKRVEKWAEVDGQGRGLCYFHGPDAEALCRKECTSALNRVVHLVELRSGEAVKIMEMADCIAFDVFSDNGKCLKCDFLATLAPTPEQATEREGE